MAKDDLKFWLDGVVKTIIGSTGFFVNSLEYGSSYQEKECQVCFTVYLPAY